MKSKKLPTHCPSCENQLAVKRLHCDACGTEVEGSYPLPPLTSLTRDEQLFIQEFVKASGSLKVMAKLMSVSYPTVRNRLNDVIEKLQAIESEKGAEHG